jgi:DNA mismatch repair ATPase MutS
MRNPLLDANEIRKRQNGVELFLESSMKDVRDHLVNLLSRIGAVDKILCRMGKCTSVPMDFVILSKTLGTFEYVY